MANEHRGEERTTPFCMKTMIYSNRWYVLMSFADKSRYSESNSMNLVVEEGLSSRLNDGDEDDGKGLRNSMELDRRGANNIGTYNKVARYNGRRR